MLEQLEKEPLALAPLRFERRATSTADGGVDASYDVEWNGRSYHYVAEVKARGTPQAIAVAVQHAKSLAYDRRDTFPLVIVPYLSPAQLEQVERLEGVSAIDLCGNGLVRAGKELFVLRSGRPNLFREPHPLKSAYRGTSSLVARSLVLKRRFPGVSEIRAFITSRGGRITLGTVSKAITRLAEDLVVARNGREIEVVQPDKLLEQLRLNYRPPRIRSRWTGKVPVDVASLHGRLLELSEREKTRVVLTGISSATEYAPLATEPIAAFYCSMEPSRVLAATKLDGRASRAFPNVEFLQTDDETVYFDRRIIDGQPCSSPVQAWLELATGDKRTREASEHLRGLLLDQAPQLEATRHGR